MTTLKANAEQPPPKGVKDSLEDPVEVQPLVHEEPRDDKALSSREDNKTSPSEAATVSEEPLTPTSPIPASIQEPKPPDSAA